MIQNDQINYDFMSVLYSLNTTIEVLLLKGYITFSFTIKINIEVDNLNKKEISLFWQKTTNNCLKILVDKNMTWSSSFFVSEINDNKSIYLHGLVFFKNITNCVDNIVVNLTNSFKKHISDFVQVDFLLTSLSIEKYCTYLLKQKNKKSLKGIFYYNTDEHDIYIVFRDSMTVMSEFVVFGFGSRNFFVKCDLPLYNHYYMKLSACDGIVFKKYHDIKDQQSDIIINIYLYYIWLHDIKYYNATFFKKTPATLISYEYWSHSMDLLSKWDEITTFYLNYFPLITINLDFFELKKNDVFWNNIFIKFDQVQLLTKIRLELTFMLIEFKDGIYNLTDNIFVKKNLVINKYPDYLKLATIKYCKFLFKKIKIPSIWLEMIIKILNYDKNKTTELLFSIGMMFATNSSEKKKNIILFVVKSNNIKMSLIIDVIITYYGLENIALLTQNNDFKLQNYENKFVMIWDEFKYHDEFHLEYLNFFDNWGFFIKEKSDGSILIESLSIIIFSENNFIEEQKNNNDKNDLDTLIKTFIISEQDFEKNELFLTKLYHQCKSKKFDAKRKNMLKILDFFNKDTNTNILK